MGGLALFEDLAEPFTKAEVALGRRTVQELPHLIVAGSGSSGGRPGGLLQISLS